MLPEEIPIFPGAPGPLYVPIYENVWMSQNNTTNKFISLSKKFVSVFNRYKAQGVVFYGAWPGAGEKAIVDILKLKYKAYSRPTIADAILPNIED